MRPWMAWMAGVLMLMSALSCACALAMPTSDSQSKPRRETGISDALPPGVVGTLESGLASGVAGDLASSPITFSTNSRAASLASAAGK